MSQIFKPSHPDFVLSPYTGMTRDSWIEAGRHLLTGVFQHIKHAEDPVVMPRTETEITYPHKDSPPEWYEVERRAEMFEGLTRSLFIAAPLLKNDPGLTLCGYPIADYYKMHILRSCTGGDPLSVGTYEEMQEITHHEDVFRPFQPTVETCALVIGLWVCRDVIWNTYTREEKDVIAAFLSSYAHANTVPQNWRLFNMLDLAFLHMNGYPIDEEIMMEHAARIVEYYAGDGWYRDGHCFDYYSCWAFQVYAPLWNLWYGYEHAPEIAQKFEDYSNALMATYADFFDEDGHVTMWGRSNVYRCAATSPFDANLYVKHPAVNPGLARRICSGSLLQFLGREDFYVNGLPSIGFYGQFAPLVQGYSCTESPFWLGKSFLCLDLPADHPFWTATEENGTWDRLQDHEVKTTTLDAPALSFTNHKANGSTLIRSGKIVKRCDDIHGMWNYGKLAFHSKYPWEATPTEDTGCPVESQQYVLRDETPTGDPSCPVESQQYVLRDESPTGDPSCPVESQQYVLRDESPTGDPSCPVESQQYVLRDESPSGDPSCPVESQQYVLRDESPSGDPSCPVESQQYVLRDETSGKVEYTNVCLWHGEKDGVLYRRQFFDYTLDRECMWMQAVNLADFPVAYGLFRADRLRLYRRPVTLTLGAFGFPDNGTEIIRISEKDQAQAIILKGKDSQGHDKQLAMTIYDGWDDLELVRSHGTNPESEHSLIIYAKCSKIKQYGGAEPSMLISQVLTKESSEDFLPEELFPVKEIVYSDRFRSGGFGEVRILMKSGDEKRICFDGMEGKLML